MLLHPLKLGKLSLIIFLYLYQIVPSNLQLFQELHCWRVDALGLLFHEQHFQTQELLVLNAQGLLQT